MTTMIAREGDGSPWTETEVGSRDRRPRRRRLTRLVLIAVAAGGVALAVFEGVLPAIRAKHREQCAANLKRLGLAFHAYHEARGSFPAPSVTGRDGRPLLSWRVELLPYLGYRSLYDEFRRDEPWDSPHNRALIARIPPEFACPGGTGLKTGLTGYQVIVGPVTELNSVNTPFEPARGVDIREITDGTSNTLLVAETDILVLWTKPDELRWDRDAPLPHFASPHEGGFHALLADGTPRFLKTTILPNILKALLTINGGEVVGGG
jgi:hypothetical protein